MSDGRRTGMGMASPTTAKEQKIASERMWLRMVLNITSVGFEKRVGGRSVGWYTGEGEGEGKTSARR